MLESNNWGFCLIVKIAAYFLCHLFWSWSNLLFHKSLISDFLFCSVIDYIHLPVKSGSGKLNWALPERCYFYFWLLKVHQFCILPIQANLRWIGIKGISVFGEGSDCCIHHVYHIETGGSWMLQWQKLKLLLLVKSEQSVRQNYITAATRTKKTGCTIISRRKCHWGTLCVTCHLCISLFALSPFSLATTSLSGKSLRSKLDLKVKHRRFPKGRGKINYDRWLCGLVVFLGAAVRSDKQAI